MVYKAPADRVVLETDPTRWNALARASSNYTPLHDALVYASPEFASLYFFRPAKIIPTSTVFLHSRRNRSGRERLVIVLMLPNLDLDNPSADFSPDVEVIAPATPLSEATESTAQLKTGYRQIFGIERIYAGQPDLNDLSHFTFTVVTDEKTLHFDGWLLDDDTVKLEPREGYPAPSTLPGTAPAR